MAELASPRPYNLPLLAFNPARLNLSPPPDVEGAKARAFAGIADSLGNLPASLIKNYQLGQQIQQQNEMQKIISDKLAKGSLEGISIDSRGNATFSGPRFAKPEATKPSLYNSVLSQFGPSASTASTASTASSSKLDFTEPELPEGGALGKVTSYGYASDPYGDDASLGLGEFKKPTGAFGDNALTESSFAASPDIEEKLKAAGVKPGDPVTLTLSNGRTVTRTWDDRTAQDADVASGKIKGVTKPLRGRFDFYSPTGEHEDEGAAVIGIAPASISSETPMPYSDPTKFPVAQPLQAPLPTPEQINAAAQDIGGKLSSANFEDLNLTAGGGGQPANIAPAATPMPVRRPTVGFNRSMGAAIISPDPTNVKAVFPGDKVVDITPTAAAAEKKTEGVVFNTPKEAIDQGFDPTDAEVLPDGRLRITKFKASGMDIKGRSKITDTMRKELGSAANLVMDMAGLEDAHKQLYSEGKAGPIMGRYNEALANFGMGAGDFVETNGTLKVSNFRIARLLNGPGVLTDKDIERAQSLAPTLKETPESFAAKMRSVRKSLKTDISNWKLKNAETATPGLMQLADEALGALDREGQAAGQVTSNATKSDEIQTINSQAEYDALPKGAKYKDSAGKTATKR